MFALIVCECVGCFCIVSHTAVCQNKTSPSSEGLDGVRTVSDGKTELACVDCKIKLACGKAVGYGPAFTLWQQFRICKIYSLYTYPRIYSWLALPHTLTGRLRIFRNNKRRAEPARKVSIRVAWRLCKHAQVIVTISGLCTMCCSLTFTAPTRSDMTPPFHFNV